MENGVSFDLTAMHRGEIVGPSKLLSLDEVLCQYEKYPLTNGPVTDYMDSTASRDLKMTVRLLEIDHHETLVVGARRLVAKQ